MPGSDGSKWFTKDGSPEMTYSRLTRFPTTYSKIPISWLMKHTITNEFCRKRELYICDNLKIIHFMNYTSLGTDMIEGSVHEREREEESGRTGGWRRRQWSTHGIGQRTKSGAAETLRGWCDELRMSTGTVRRSSLRTPLTKSIC